MLTDDALRKLIKTPESRTLERKRNCPNGAELRKTLVALANSTFEDEYSILFLGIDDDGRIVGLNEDGLDSMQKTIAKASEECFPAIPVVIQAFQADGNILLAVIIRDTQEKPHFSGRSYRRVGSVSKQASRESIDELINHQNDKVRRILREKGKPISISFPDGASAGLRSVVGGTDAPNTANYIVYACDKWVLKFVDSSTKKRFACALAGVDINWDTKRDRLRLDVEINYFRDPFGY